MTRRVVNRSPKDVQGVAAKYRRKGYEVIVSPKTPDLPAFLSDMSPDLIAIRDDDRVVVEIKTSESLSSSKDLVELAKRVEKHRGWRLDFAVTARAPHDAQSAREALDTKGVKRRLQSARLVLGDSDPGGALLLAWSALEAILMNDAWRADLGVQRRPPLSVVKAMYAHGYMSWGQHELLDRAGRLRNDIAHGTHTIEIPAKLVRDVIEYVGLLVSDRFPSGLR